MNCDAATAFSIDSGDCTACGECFHTPNYLAGGDYHHDHDCTITFVKYFPKKCNLVAEEALRRGRVVA